MTKSYVQIGVVQEKRGRWYIIIKMRHQSDSEIGFTKLRIQIVNQGDQSARTFEAQLPFKKSSRKLILNEFLEDTCRRGLNLNGAQIFHTDISNRIHAFLGVYPFSGEVLIAAESIINDCIQLSFKHHARESTAMYDASERESVYDDSKQRKVKERTIGEAMNAVRDWRMLYETADQQGKRVYTLEEAAKVVGVSKKTLDDYYIHMRVAYEFNFNLERFQDSKVGVLRKFVRIARERGIDGLRQEMPDCIIDMDTDKYWQNFQDL